MPIGARVKFSGKSRTVVDGPFTEAKELVAGFSILQVNSLEEAIEWLHGLKLVRSAAVSATDPHQVFHRTIEALWRIESARQATISESDRIAFARWSL